MPAAMQKLDIFEQLKTYSQKMANSIKPMLATMALENYYQYLDMMYHYTLNSGERLRHAAKNILDPEFSHLLSELARKENNYYQIAEADLNDVKHKPSSTIPKEVTDFNNFWFGIKPQEQSIYLGAICTLENVAPYLKNEALECFSRLGIELKQARFLSIHLGTDSNHATTLEKFCHKFGEQDPVNLFHGAEKSSQLWIRMHAKVLN